MTWTEEVQATGCTVRELSEVWAKSTIADDRRVSRSLSVALAINPQLTFTEIRTMLPWIESSRHCADVYLAHRLEKTEDPAAPEQLHAEFPQWRAEIEKAVMVSERLHKQLEYEAEYGPGLDLVIDDQFGQYTLVRLIGRGAQGEVYEAVSTQHPELRVALKIFLRSDSRLREQIGARLVDHHAVAQLMDFGEFDGLGFIAYRLVDGVTLTQHAQKLSGGRMDWREACELVCAVGEGVAAIHGAGLVHRDIKPANIIVDQTGQPVLVDLGITLDVASAENSGMEGSVCWMAPEQYNGAGSVPISDVYALAGVLFWLLSGNRPNGRTATDAKVTLSKMEAPNLQALPASIPQRLVGVLERAMDPTPRRRTASASRFIDELRAVLDDRPIDRIDTPKTAARMFLRRHRTAVRVAGLGFVLLGIASVIGVRSLVRAETRSLEQKLDRMTVQTEKGRELMEQVMGGFFLTTDVSDAQGIFMAFQFNRAEELTEGLLTASSPEDRYQAILDAIATHIDDDSSNVMKAIGQELAGIAAQGCDMNIEAGAHFLAADRYWGEELGWDHEWFTELRAMRSRDN